MNDGQETAEQAQAPSRPWPVRLGLGVAAVLALSAVVALRRPEGLTEPTIWAEDGSVFMSVAWEGPGQVAYTYAGQFWPLQHLLALLVGLTPPTAWPTLLYLLACLGVGLVAAVPLMRRGRILFGALPFRWLLALLIALLPGAFEVQGNITNLHWWATGALMLIAAMPAPQRRWTQALELAAFLILGMTGPTALFVLPVALWRVVAGPRGSRYLWARVGVLAAAAIMIAIAALTGGRAESNSVTLADLPGFLYVKWGGVLSLGESLMASGDLGPSSPEMALAGVMIVVLVTLALADLRGPSWIWLAVGLAAAVLGAAVGAKNADAAAILEPFSNTRYLVPLLLASVAVLVRGVRRGGSGESDQWRRVIAIGGLLLVALGSLGDARLPAAGAAVDRAQLESLRPCFNGEPPYSDAVGCTVEVVPEGWQLVVLRPGWEGLRDQVKDGQEP